MNIIYIPKFIYNIYFLLVNYEIIKLYFYIIIIYKNLHIYNQNLILNNNIFNTNIK